MNSATSPRFRSPAFVIGLLLACRSSPPTRDQAIALPAPQGCGQPNQAVVEYQATIRNAPSAVVAMMKAFPKGGDLHNHLSGAVMAEDYIAIAATDSGCYGPASDDPKQLAMKARGISGACDPNDHPLSGLGQQERDLLVRSLSMHEFKYPSIQAGHDQFFAVFSRFGAFSDSAKDRGQLLAKLLVQAEMDSVSYVEIMVSLQSKAVTELAYQLRAKFPDSAFSDPQQVPAMLTLIARGLAETAKAARDDISQYSEIMRDTLGCARAPKNPGCAVSFRFLSAVNRSSAFRSKPDHAKMFVQTALSFLLADPEGPVVGVNLVSGEDLPMSMMGFAVQMRHFLKFHALYPKAKIALHGGELTPCFVGAGNPALLDHLTGAITAGAQRIGHGISFAYLDPQHKQQVADLMLRENVLVEIPMASNAQILGVAGAEHPFTQYFRDFQIPAALATDDQGVSHTDFTSAWVYAYLEYHLTYEEASKLARLSLQHAFLPGSSLWQGAPGGQTTPDCQQIALGAPVPSKSRCEAFLQANPKANLQWNLEARLLRFRETYGPQQWP
jgi:adenosine deaminase